MNAEFTVLLSPEERRSLEFPAVVPWGLVQPHERQAMSNHGGQTLRRLNERGGLSPQELWAVLNNEPLGAIRRMGITPQKAAAYIEARMDKYALESQQAGRSEEL